MFGTAPPVNGNPDTIATDVDILTGRARAAVHAAADRIRSECPPADGSAPGASAAQGEHRGRLTPATPLPGAGATIDNCRQGIFIGVPGFPLSRE